MPRNRNGSRQAERRRWRRYKAKRQNGLCAICGQPMGHDVTLDHIVPLSVGGADHLDNAQAVHDACNNAKGNKVTEHDWIKGACA